jgi:hypothetical protein
MQVDNCECPVVRFADLSKYVVSKKMPPTLPTASKAKPNSQIDGRGVEVDSEDNDVESKEDGLSDDENDDDDDDEILQAARVNAPVYHLELDAGVSLDSRATALRDLLSDKPTTDLLRPSKRPAVNPDTAEASNPPTFDFSQPLRWV